MAGCTPWAPDQAGVRPAGTKAFSARVARQYAGKPMVFARARPACRIACPADGQVPMPATLGLRIIRAASERGGGRLWRAQCVLVHLVDGGRAEREDAKEY